MCSNSADTAEAYSVSVIPVDAECWEEALIALEGPFYPLDIYGNRYGFTGYVVCVMQFCWTDAKLRMWSFAVGVAIARCASAELEANRRM